IMILNKNGRKNVAPQNFDGPIANSTAVGQSMNMTQNVTYLNDTDQFFTDQYSTNAYKPHFPPNGFYENQSMYEQSFQANPVVQPQANVPPQFFNPTQNFINEPMASMAMMYGSNLADQGKEFVQQNVDKWFSISKLKYYFVVDTNYVAKKLLIILFPFLNRDWSVKYTQGEVACPPKLDVNAPDMYIPVMAFVTYILMVGVTLGLEDRFTPEKLGIYASSALGWFIIEVLIIFLSLQILSIKSALTTFDIMAFCGYKYFGMIMCLAGQLVVPNAYYFVLLYMSLSFTYFMVRNLKLMILAGNSTGQSGNGYESQTYGNKRRIYVLLFISLLQPFFMWWLTYNKFCDQVVKLLTSPQLFNWYEGGEFYNQLRLEELIQTYYPDIEQDLNSDFEPTGENDPKVTTEAVCLDYVNMDDKRFQILTGVSLNDFMELYHRIVNINELGFTKLTGDYIKSITFGYIYKTYCLSQFTYGLGTTTLEKKSKEALNTSQNNLLRHIIGLKGFRRKAFTIHRLDSLLFHQWILFKSGILIVKLVQGFLVRVYIKTFVKKSENFCLNCDRDELEDNASSLIENENESKFNSNSNSNSILR
ncbi:YIF1B-like isoform X1, partial [Brachionus plicatilis]